jgi:uncharacterized membrane protein YfcA
MIIVDEFINNLGLSFLIIGISIITTIGGVGGGGILIPVYMLIGKFKLEEAISLSIATILGDTLVRIILLINKKHIYFHKRYLIDLSPLLLIVLFDGNSSFIGVILADLIPKIVTVIVIILVIGIIFIKTTYKAYKSFKKENYNIKNNSSNYELYIIDGIGEFIDKRKLLDYIGSGDSTKDKNIKLLIQLSCVLITSIFSLTRTFLEKYSLYYFLHILLQFLFIGIIGYFIIKFILNDYYKKRNSDYVFLEGDIVWNRKNIIKFIVMASFTGMISTYLGIGGGIIITPLLISVGMLPEVVVASTSITTFFSSFISTVNYLLAGQLLWKFSLVFGICSGIGAIIGLKISNMVLKKFKRQSFITFIVSGVLLTSLVLLVFNSFN